MAIFLTVLLIISELNNVFFSLKLRDIQGYFASLNVDVREYFS